MPQPRPRGPRGPGGSPARPVAVRVCYYNVTSCAACAGVGASLAAESQTFKLAELTLPVPLYSNRCQFLQHCIMLNVLRCVVCGACTPPLPPRTALAPPSAPAPPPPGLPLTQPPRRHRHRVAPFRRGVSPCPAMLPTNCRANAAHRCAAASPSAATASPPTTAAASSPVSTSPRPLCLPPPARYCSVSRCRQGQQVMRDTYARQMLLGSWWASCVRAVWHAHLELPTRHVIQGHPPSPVVRLGPVQRTSRAAHMEVHALMGR